MTAKTKFEVTDRAGVFVAGVRSPGKGKTLELTEEQAVDALRMGELRRPGQGRKPARATAPAGDAAPAAGGDA